MNRLFIILILLSTVGNVCAKEKEDVIIIPLLDSHYQVTRLQYPGPGRSVVADLATGIIVGVLTGVVIVPVAQQLTVNQATHYRPYVANLNIETLVIEKLRKVFANQPGFNIYGILDMDDKVVSLREKWVNNKVHGKTDDATLVKHYLEVLKGSGFDKVVFVTNESSIYKYGARKTLPLHGYGLIYDFRKNNTLYSTVSYFGATIEAFNIKTKENHGRYSFFKRVVLNTVSDDANAFRSRNVVKFLESKYQTQIGELPEYNYLLNDGITRSNARNVLAQYKKDIYINDRNKLDYYRLKMLLNRKAHHQYGEFSDLSEDAKAAAIRHAAMIFENDNFDLIGYVDLEFMEDDEYAD